MEADSISSSPGSPSSSRSSSVASTTSRSSSASVAPSGSGSSGSSQSSGASTQIDADTDPFGAFYQSAKHGDLDRLRGVLEAHKLSPGGFQPNSAFPPTDDENSDAEDEDDDSSSSSSSGGSSGGDSGGGSGASSGTAESTVDHLAQRSLIVPPPRTFPGQRLVESKSGDSTLHAEQPTYHDPGMGLRQDSAVCGITESFVRRRRGSKLWTALHAAAYNGHAKMCALLLRLGASASIQNKNGDTPLMLASYQGEADAARVLLELDDSQINVVDSNGLTPLICAMANGHFDTAELLLEAGADMLHVSPEGENLLHSALWRADPLVLERLLGRFEQLALDDHRTSLAPQIRVIGSKSADDLSNELPSQDRLDEGKRLAHPFLELKYGEDSMTPLQLACDLDKPECIRLLVQYGADWNAVQKNGRSCLYTTTLRSVDATAALLTAASAETADPFGRAPLDIDAKTKPAEGTALFGVVCDSSVDTLALLLEHGAAVNIVDGFGCTPLMLAKTKGVASALLEHGAKMSGEHGFVLPHAVMSDSLEVATVLLQHGAPMDGALNEAVQRGALSLAELFLQWGADPNEADEHGDTPLMNLVRFQVSLTKPKETAWAEFLGDRVSSSLSGAELTAAIVKGATLALVKVLLSAGSDPLVRNRSGLSAIDMAITRGRDDALVLLRNHASGRPI